MNRIKLFGMLMIFLTFVFISCENEGSNGNDIGGNNSISLVGTTWSNVINEVKITLQFITTSTGIITLTSVSSGGTESGNFTYSLSGNNIQIVHLDSVGSSGIGTISGNQMTYVDNYDGSIWLLFKQ